MKKIILFSLLFCLIFTSKIHAEEDSGICSEENYYRLKESTVQLYIKTSDNYLSCTGIVIYKDEKSTGVLTAQHCTKNAIEISTFVIPTGIKYTSFEFYESSKTDVAYVVFNNILRYSSPTPIARYNPRKNDDVYILGYTLFQEIYNCSKIIGIGSEHFYTDATIYPGCSGSGIINEYGELIGILYGHYSNGKSIFVNLYSIKRFLRSIKYKGKY